MVKQTALAKRSRKSAVKKSPRLSRNRRKKNRNSFGRNISSPRVPPLPASIPAKSRNKSSPLPANSTANEPAVFENNKKTCNNIVEKTNTKLIPMDICNDSSSESVISISDSSSDESNDQVKVGDHDKRIDDSCFIIDVEPTDLNEQSSFYKYTDNNDVSENKNEKGFDGLLKQKTKNRLIDKIYPSLNDESLPSTTSSENAVETYVIHESSDEDNARSSNHNLDVNSNPSLGISNDSNKSETYLHYNGLEQLTSFMRKESRKKNKKQSLKNKRRQVPLMTNSDDELGPDDEFGPGDCDPNSLHSLENKCGLDDECVPHNELIPDVALCSDEELGLKNGNNPNELKKAPTLDEFQKRYKNMVSSSPFSLVNNWINKINEDTPYEDLVKQTSFQPIIPVANEDEQVQNISDTTEVSNTIVNLTPVCRKANLEPNCLNSRIVESSGDKQTTIAPRPLGVNTDQLINCIETITNMNTDVNPNSDENSTADQSVVFQNTGVFSSAENSQKNIPGTIYDNTDKPSTSNDCAHEPDINIEKPSTSYNSDQTSNNAPQTYITLQESSDSDIEFIDEYNPLNHLIELSDDEVPTVIKVKTKGKKGQKKTNKKGTPKQKKKSLTKKKRTEESQQELNERLRPIVIDGCNVGMGHSRSKSLSVAGIKICYDYFINKGHEVKIFLPQSKKYHPLTTDTKQLDKWEREGVVIFTPGRKVNGICIYSYDDRFILEYAALTGAIVISRDNYRDLYAERPDFRDTILNRLLQYTFVDDLIMFPSDPLGRNGPHLDNFLKFPPTKVQPSPGVKPKGQQPNK